MRWITATHLVQWANTRIAESDMSLLLRKLIIASVKEWPEIHIPAGDSIFKPGWDGICHTVTKSKLVPSGLSCWEWGRDNDYKSKLNDDFKKRTLATLPESQMQQTFVFVTPRRWINSKDETIANLKAKSKWKDILIYDADDLELWLEHCPAVGRWLALELRVMTEDVYSAEEFWVNYTGLSEYIFTTDFIIGGRNEPSANISKFINNESDVIELKAASREEGAAFVIASLLHANAEKEQLVFCNSIIVRNSNYLKQINELHKELLIIYLPENDETVTMIGNLSNHIISIVSNRAKIRHRDIILEKPDSGHFTQGLIAMGVDSREAYNLTKICGRSYDVLRRMFTDQAGRVSWPAEYVPADLIAIFFVQKFDDAKEGDRSILTKLSGKECTDYKAGLKKWTLVTGPPVAQEANKWQVVSPFDLLYIVGNYITEEHLQLFESAFMQVLSGHDPALDLEPHMRIAANLLGKEDRYSKWLKDGIAQTLALLSAFGKDSGINTSIEIHSWINQIVRQLLDTHELRFWQSVESKIHLLAEAAPQAFLEKMESLVQQHPSVVSELFNDQEAVLWSHPYHTHILWALEILAWDALLLPRVALLLGRIIQLDKGKAYGNRPSETLTNIFRWWYPRTFAGFEDRKNVVNVLIKRNPDIAFSLLISLAPHISNIAMDNHKPLWSMKQRYEIKTSQAEYLQGLTFNCEKLLEVAANDPNRWVKVIELADDHQGFLRDMIIEKAVTIEFDSSKSDALRESLDSLLRAHASTGKKDSDWKLSKKHQSALRKMYDNLNRTTTDRHIALFNVESIETRATGDDWDKQLKLITSKRLKAVKLILKEDGLDSVFEMIPKIKHPFRLGQALAQSQEQSVDEVILKISLEEPYQKFVIGYMASFIEKEGYKWIEQQVDDFAGRLSERELIIFYLATEACPDIWIILEKRSQQLYDLYWQTIFTHIYNPWFSKENSDAVIRNLNSYKRFTTSLNQIYDESRINPSTILDTLKGYAMDNCEPDKTLRSQDYLIRKLYKYLLAKNADPEEMHILEWYYFQLLKKDRHEKNLITYLYKNLNEHPDFFARLIQFLYIPEEGEPKEEIEDMTPENVRGRAQNADAVLTGWSTLPGTDEHGNCDFNALRIYFTAAIQHCTDLKRRKHGIRELGKLLGRADIAGVQWPHPEICEMIEEYNSEVMNEGFYTGYYNRHAGEVRIRPATSNNDEELTEVIYLKDLAKNLASSYPLTSKIITDIAASKQHWVEFMNKRDRQYED